MKLGAWSTKMVKMQKWLDMGDVDVYGISRKIQIASNFPFFLSIYFDREEVGRLLTNTKKDTKEMYGWGKETMGKVKAQPFGTKL